MRVLINIDELGPIHGVAVSTFQISRELARRGHEIDVAYLRSGDFEPEFRSFSRKLVRMPAMSVGRNPRRMHRLARSIVRGISLRPDVVYDNVVWSLPWSYSVAALGRAGLLCYVGGFTEDGPGLATRVMMRRGANRFLACSSYAREQAIGVGVPAGRISVVHPGLASSDYPVGGPDESRAARRALGLRPDSYVVLYFGRISPGKGIEVLLDAIRRSASASEIDLLLVGRPFTDEYLASVQKLGEGLSTFWQPAARVDVVTPLHAADVVVVPSMAPEAFGRVAIEALATGRPVLASRAPGLAEIFTGDFERFLFTPGDAVELATAIDSLRNWRDRERDLAVRCVDHVQRNFDIVAMTEKVEAHLADAALRHGLALHERGRRRSSRSSS